MKTLGSSSGATYPTRPSPATLPPKRFALSGRSPKLDPRFDAARRDIADVRLADRVFAPHYAVPLPRTCRVQAAVREGCGNDAPTLSEVLPGERFDLLECSGGCGWGISSADAVVGYVALSAFGPFAGDLPEPSPAPDFVAVAEGLVGTPWRVGGRSPAGVDGDGLVHFALASAGRLAPRFRDGQLALGEEISETGPLQRGDLLFFADHMAIMTDSSAAVHVGAGGPMARDSLDEMLAGGAYGPVTVRRRIA